jgi:hypothetical protein
MSHILDLIPDAKAFGGIPGDRYRLTQAGKRRAGCATERFGLPIAFLGSRIQVSASDSRLGPVI